MFQSRLFTKTRKEVPKDEVSKNAQLLIRGGFIHKEMAGVYTILPLGLRVIRKIEDIIREEMNNVGGQEIYMSALQEQSLWEKTDRWDDEKVDIWFKTKLKNGTELGLATTHEEPLTALLANHISSHRDLPVYIYQFQTKFRNELRSKSGIMRGREFLMKDLYSFSKDEEGHKDFYEVMKRAYMNVFLRVGIGTITYITFSSGGSFSKYSHEFQTITEAGEDTIHLCQACRVAVNEEIFGEQKTCPECGNVELISHKAVEVGNIFPLGTRFSKAMSLKFMDKDGGSKDIIMGSYGIGLGRLMGTIVEVLSDERGIIWPESVAPFKLHLLSFNKNEDALKIYKELTDSDVEVLFDDRDLSAGEKLSDADLLGIPYRIIVSDKSLVAGGVEMKRRDSGESKIVGASDILDQLQ